MTPFEEQFWARVERADGCWAWLGPRKQGSYGVTRSPDRRPIGAHRLAWQLANGRALGRHEYVCHRCDNPICVRPDHLFVGSQLDNMRDAKAKGRTRNPNPARGERCKTSKLTPEAVTEIRRAFLAGEGCRPIARRFGIDRAQVKRIVRGQSWAHLPMPSLQEVA